jgi:hypothetical protein
MSFPAKTLGPAVVSSSPNSNGATAVIANGAIDEEDLFGDGDCHRHHHGDCVSSVGGRRVGAGNAWPAVTPAIMPRRNVSAAEGPVFIGVLVASMAGFPMEWLSCAIDMSPREFRGFAIFMVVAALWLMHAIATSDSAP